MVNWLMNCPVLLRKQAPIVGTSVPLCTPPKARSVLAVAPKLYVSPVPLEPVPAVYSPSFAVLVPVSVKNHPAGTVLLVPVLASVSKFSVTATPPVFIGRQADPAKVCEINGACVFSARFGPTCCANAGRSRTIPGSSINAAKSETKDLFTACLHEDKFRSELF